MTNSEYIEAVATYLIEKIKYTVEFNISDIGYLLVYISLNDLLNYEELTDLQRSKINAVMQCIKQEISIPDTIKKPNPRFLLLEDNTGIEQE